MDEERLGIYRNSMDENPLLLKVRRIQVYPDINRIPRRNNIANFVCSKLATIISYLSLLRIVSGDLRKRQLIGIALHIN